MQRSLQARLVLLVKRMTRPLPFCASTSAGAPSSYEASTATSPGAPGSSSAYEVVRAVVSPSRASPVKMPSAGWLQSTCARCAVASGWSRSVAVFTRRSGRGSSGAMVAL